ncbi:uncharacterized protein M6B38_383020 [Iris pallida]|uniref:Uncharacterized protein n=1 Tax=Iris pallida TaxID=29817 RepID=A0AAX6G5G0_IRIPA|nr:uncharacterized protein M6B38_383020 [Iris pallida]
MPMEPRRLALLLQAIVLLQAVKALQSDTGVPTPTLWPERFHALLFMNVSTTGHLQVTDLWYDWPKGRNLNLMQKQLGDLLHDVEWNNGTSYYYTLGPAGTCLVRDFGVGIPRRDWLAGSTYLGRRHTDGFLCHVWEKVDFIWYYEDVDTRRPVRWDFYDGIRTHVMTFEVGAALEDSEWQAPTYCFTDDDTDDESRDRRPNGDDLDLLMGDDVDLLMDHSIRKLVQRPSE